MIRPKTKKFVIAPDPHGNEQDEKSCSACVEFCRDFKPDVAVINGDLWDFAALRKGASQDEQSVALDDDYDAGVSFAEKFFGRASEKYLLFGNHDDRVFRLLDASDGRMRSLGRACVQNIENWTSKSSIKTLPYDARYGVLPLGHLNVVHGYFTGQNACASHSRVYGNVVFGHVHSIESYQTPGLKIQEARAIGCLCKLDLPYVNHKTAKLRWSNGWGYGFLYPNGTYILFQARKIDGQFHVATDFKSF